MTKLDKEGLIILTFTSLTFTSASIPMVISPLSIDIHINQIQIDSLVTIQHEVRLFKTTSLEKDFMLEMKVESKNMAMTTRRITSNAYKENNVPYPNQPQRLRPQQQDEKRAKGPFFNCDNKYF